MGILSLFKSNSGIVESAKLLEDFSRLLTENEEIEVGFRLENDTFIFTNKRLLLEEINKKEKKGIEYKSIPYTNISHIGISATKPFAEDATLKIWTKGAGFPEVEKDFNRSVDIYEVQKLFLDKMK